MLESIGHYQIRRKIGEGAMGVVYEGWDDRLQRSVAVKAMNGANESHVARENLWREARSLARVNHPHVCQVYDVLEEAESLILVLELLNGQSLSDRLLNGGITAAEAVGIERQILQALQALHDLDIVHRDLKPSNVFLTPHGVKLLDFGLARNVKLSQSIDSASPTMTAPGLIVGTPFYMAPEQAGGSAAGPEADIFAVGAILYEMLTGRRPFEGATIVDVLYAVRHHNPPPLSGSREIEALDRIIRRAMEKRIEGRYASAREMLAALDTISLSPSSEAALRTRTVTRVIVLPFRTLKSDEQTDLLTFTLPEAISNSLSAMNSLIVRSSLLASRFDGQPDPRRVAVEADVDAFLTGSLLRAGDRFRLTCQLVEAPAGTVIWSETANSSMQDLFTIQDELCERILQSLRIPLDERENRHSHRDVPATARAYECYLRANQISHVRTPNEMGLARDLYLQCIEESPNFAPAWALLGRVYHFMAKFGPAPDYFGQAERAFKRAFDLNADLPIAHNCYTPVECDQGKANQAMLRLLKRARIRRNDPDLFAGLVHACRCCGELDASIAAHLRGRHLDPHLVTSAAHTYFLLGDYKSTIDSYRPGRRYYLDCAALSALGENQAALTLLRERENSGTPVLALMRSLRAYLEGDPEGCFNAIMQNEIDLFPDPEAYFYSARHLARIGKTDHAISALQSALDRGFTWTTAALSDPWFDSLRSLPKYVELLGLAQQKSSEIHAAFLEAGGEQVIRVA